MLTLNRKEEIDKLDLIWSQEHPDEESLFGVIYNIFNLLPRSECKEGILLATAKEIERVKCAAEELEISLEELSEWYGQVVEKIERDMDDKKSIHKHHQ